jgi:hypothetical protein
MSTRIRQHRSGTGRRRAAAYCGPGHGRRWRLPPGNRPAPLVWIRCGSDDIAYRPIVDCRTGRIALDQDHCVIYLPIAVAGPARWLEAAGTGQCDTDGSRTSMRRWYDRQGGGRQWTA